MQLAPTERPFQEILVAIGYSAVVVETTMRGYDNEGDVSIPDFVGFKSTFPIVLLFVQLLPSLLSFEF